MSQMRKTTSRTSNLGRERNELNEMQNIKCLLFSARLIYVVRKLIFANPHLHIFHINEKLFQ